MENEKNRLNDSILDQTSGGIDRSIRRPHRMRCKIVKCANCGYVFYDDTEAGIPCSVAVCPGCNTHEVNMVTEYYQKIVS